jgi:DNA-binding transcriptional LysR family regulator
MDLRHARTFVTVAELGTVSKAALRLHIAQPALSRQIGDLEEELGLSLFDRVGRRLVLTSDGEQMLGECRGLLEHASALNERARQLQRGDSGVLKVSAAPNVIECVLADFLHRYAERYPKVQVKLTDTPSFEMMALLERGEIDLGQTLVRAIRPEDYQRFGSHPLEPVEILAACHPELKLGKNGTVEIAELAPHRLLHGSPEYVTRQTFDAACRLAGFTPNVVLESRAPNALLAMAEARHGVAIVPSVVPTHHHVLRFVCVTYQGKLLREPLTMLWNKRRALPHYATAFCEMLGDYVREVFPIARPSEPKNGPLAKRAAARRVRGRG